jgi:hypothetical protein
MTEKRFDALGEFLASYFHQDWRHVKSHDGWTPENPDPDAVVESFIEGEPPSSVRKAADEIEELLSLGFNESELKQIIHDDLGSYYLPAADEMSYGDWLRHLHNLLVRPE